jgi:hypothetical protein
MDGHLYAQQGAPADFAPSVSNENEVLVQCPVCVQWGKWVAGDSWMPDLTLTVETSDTVEIADVIRTNQPVSLTETWDPERLELADWWAQPPLGSLEAVPGAITWSLPPSGFQVVTITKVFHVEPSTWTTAAIAEVLRSQGELVEERVVEIEKEPSDLRIESYYDPAAAAGQSAFFALEYWNEGGYENSVTITNTFPVTAPYHWSDPAPSASDPGGLWARWDVGDIPREGHGTIVVEVALSGSLAPSTTVPIWDGIYDHAGILRDEVTTTFHVVGPPEAVWEKWIEGEPWYPEMAITVETSQTLTVVDIIQTSASFTLREEWDPDRLQLLEVQKTTGSTTGGADWLEWHVGEGDPLDAVITKTFVVQQSTWTETGLVEALGISGEIQDQKAVTLLKAQPILMIEAAHDPQVVSGFPATIDLSYANQSGRESRAWIHAAFPPQALFEGSDPPPTDGHPEGLWAMWELGGLHRGQEGVIPITVAVAPGLEISSALWITTTIYNHVDDPQSQVPVALHVGPVPPPEWEKRINGLLWAPDLVVTAETSATVEVVDVFGALHPFNITADWDLHQLTLTGWEREPEVGTIYADEGFLEWTVQPLGEGQRITLTKWYRLEACAWEAAAIREMLSVSDEIVEERPVYILKDPPDLWLASQHEPEVTPGHTASFTLHYGNEGGYENEVWIRNEFPSEAPFESSDPAPAETSDNRRTVWWNVGELARGDEGTITVTVAVSETVPYSSSIGVWDGIYDHVFQLQDETYLQYVIPGTRVYLPLVMRDGGA